MDGIKEKTALVTGAAKGIGRAIAERLASEGAIVCIADYDAAALDAAVASMERQGLFADGYLVDMYKPADIRDMVKNIHGRHGSLDILVNNVGTTIRKKVFDLSEDEFDKVMDLNVKSYFIS